LDASQQAAGAAEARLTNLSLKQHRIRPAAMPRIRVRPSTIETSSPMEAFTVPPAPIATTPPAEAASPPAAVEVTTSTPEALQECVANKPCRVKVFFATDRNLVPPARVPSRFTKLQYYFGGDRELKNLPAAGYKLGECMVTIPDTNYVKFSGKLDYESGVYDPTNSIYVEDDRLYDDEKEWLTSLNRRIDANREQEAFVFIHGFNVSFIDAARRTAQIYYDLGFKGAPIFYSWPSGGNLWNYWADEASVEWSAGHLRNFLDFVAQQSHAKRIHLIAHSMGNRALTHALADLGNRNADAARNGCPIASTKFQQVILAAPDLDTDLFLQLESAIKSVATHVTLYASKRDRAVLASWILHRFTRLGFPSRRSAPPDIDAIDATAASSDFLGHSYYGQSVLWDIKQLFDKPEVAIAERCTIKAREQQTAYYRFIAQPLGAAPGKIRRGINFVFRKRKTDVISSCPMPTPAAGAGR
jgi:esterase/lipase superfamily enzyme